MATLRILGEDDVRAAINAETALEIARRTLRDQADARSILSSPSAMVLDAAPVGGPKFKFKAAAVGHLNASGIRLLSHPGPTAMNMLDLGTPALSWVQLAGGMGVEAERVTDMDGFNRHFQAALTHKGPKLIEVMM